VHLGITKVNHESFKKSIALGYRNKRLLTVLPEGQPEAFRFSGRSSPPEGLRGGPTPSHFPRAKYNSHNLRINSLFYL